MTENEKVPVLYPRGEIAYEAYRTASDGRSLISGNRIPPWKELAWELQLAWHKAATAVIVDDREKRLDPVFNADTVAEIHGLFHDPKCGQMLTCGQAMLLRQIGSVMADVLLMGIETEADEEIKGASSE